VVQVPVGIYEIRGTPLSASGIRKSWGVQEGQKVFLSFGSVRDGKNLDLAVQALAQVPEAFLVLAGAVASCNDKNFTYYRELAARLGVMNRCYFVEGFVADEELGHYFSGTDFVLLIYAASFHSQSGVLHLAARAHKAVLASAAPSPLLKSVRDYGLGKVILPDSLEEVVLGMQNLLKSLPQPRWEDYEASASWDLNAREILKAAKCVASS
jgi:glycosyltransferase involved in cell wall biosynthesis